MLLWLEEAGIEIAMILAVAVGVFMLVAAVWSLIDERLRLRERRGERTPAQPSAAPTDHTHPSGHHA
jgi:hypothetical protein